MTTGMVGPVICRVFVGRARDLEALHAVLNRVRRGSSQTVLLSGEAFSVVEHSLKPGAATPPHTHAHEDEYSYVLEGKIGARIGDKVVEATPGMYVFKPRGVPRAFWNAGPEPARILEIIAPAGLKQYFADMAPLFDGPGAPDPGKVAEIAARYDLTYHMDHMDWIPDLSAYENTSR